MKKGHKIRPPDKAAGGETLVSREKSYSGLVLGVWDEELKERFRVVKREAGGEGLFIYLLEKFN
jgi:hypothetical protein